ncbi:unnamed protein product [Prunus armeniaca]|uniref:Uncharacterized protein n=1 Tax=Prunus armeniaca TaxID=36596 RepID=A0A6J5US08_PRUAR|nr:unnamed protein product [Prunus armeniaca]
MLGFVEGVLEGCTVDAMSESEKHFVSHVLSFFAASDGIVLETYFKDSREKHRLFNEIESEGRLSGLWIGYTERLVALACVEGIFFFESFCAIFWFKKRGLMPGLTFSHELISRDSTVILLVFCTVCWGSNCLGKKFMALYMKLSRLRPSLFEAHPCALIGMNSDLMSQYIKFVVDRLLVYL